jgi:NAD(P)-dependent dehydrogenase (short-subunit alcohol dehydrogenase family)
MTPAQVPTALVTGAGGSIGGATASVFSESGYSVVASDIDGSRLEALAKSLEGPVVTVVGDVRQAADCRKMVDAALEAFGRLDAVVCVPGVEINGTVDDLEEEDWDAVLDTNLRGTFLMCQAAVPALRGNGGGAIVTIGSVIGRASLPTATAYSAAKAGVEALTRTMALDHAREGIRVNCVLPGPVDTPHAWQGVAQDEIADLRARVGDEVPIGRVGQPQDIAAAIHFLCSDSAAFITGVGLPVDGGLLAKGALSH